MWKQTDQLTVLKNDFKTAANRACDNQHNECAKLANNKSGKFSVGQCDQQSSELPLALPLAHEETVAANLVDSPVQSGHRHGDQDELQRAV